ncbi:hypothetical protein [uncultured Algibacter sp.]|uniref:hypothetical protein n=1 Tax=uncultured Algibacter sp. TaxID=298659 RepID=UPI003217EF57
MKTKFFTLFIACFVVTSIFSQSNLNQYKYVIVPHKFDFLKEKNKYQINALTKFLFSKYGFETVMEGSEYPEDLARNRCLALRSNVVKGSGLFKTKLSIQLHDCNDKLVFTSKEGESREKEYKTAYNLALRDAFKSVEALNYKYEPSTAITSIATPAAPQIAVNNGGEVTNEIKALKEEIQNLKKEKASKVVNTETKVISTKTVAQEPIKTTEALSSVLYAQAISNGFQLVDSSPKVLYRIKSTGLADTYLVENKNAIIYKNGNDWVLEYYSGDTLKQEALNIKF